MRYIGLLQQGLKLLMPLTLLACDGMSKAARDGARPHDDIPTPTATAMEAEIPLDGSAVKLQVDNLDRDSVAGRGRLSVAFEAMTGSSARLADLQKFPLSGCTDGQANDGAACKVEVNLDAAKAKAVLQGGLVYLHACVADASGGRCDQQQANPARVFIPPLFDAPISVLQLTQPDVKALTVTVLPGDKSPSAASGLFVTTGDDTTYQRTLIKYIYNTAQNNLIADNKFTPISVPGFLNLYFGFFAVSAKYALSLEFRNAAFLGYHLTPYQLNPLMTGQQIAFLDRPASRIVPTIVSAAPDSAVVMIADNQQIDVLNFDYNVGYNPVSSLMLSSPLQYLSASHAQLTAPAGAKATFDAVGVDRNNQLQIYSLKDNDLTLADSLTALANQQLASAKLFIGSKIVGLAVRDIDRDQSPDLVMAIETATGTANAGTQNIAWLRYIGDNKFALRSVALPSPVKGVIGISVGDLNADGRDDIALTTNKDVQVYLNKR